MGMTAMGHTLYRLETLHQWKDTGIHRISHGDSHVISLIE